MTLSAAAPAIAFVALALSGAAVPQDAPPAAVERGERQAVDPSAVPDPARPRTEGIDRSSFRWAQSSDQSWILVASITPTPGWHVYWENPGDSGNAPTFELTLPAGWRAGRTVFPRPEARTLDGSVFYGYSRSVEYLIPVKRVDGVGDDPWSRDNKPDANAAWKVRAKVMACKERCTVSTLVAGGDWPPLAEAGTDVRLNGGSFGGRALPATAASAGIFASLENNTVRIEGPSRGTSTVRFIPAAIPGMQLGVPDGSVAVDGSVNGDRFRVEFTLQSLGQGPGEPAVAGLILLGNDPSEPCVWLTIPHPLAGPDGAFGANGVGASDQAPPSK